MKSIQKHRKNGTMLLVSITNDHTLKSRMMGNYHVRFGSGGGESDLSANHNRLRNGERWPGWEQAKKTLRESRQYRPGDQRSVRQALAGSVLSPGQGVWQASFAGWRQGEKKPGFPRFKPQAPVLHACVILRCTWTSIMGNTSYPPDRWRRQLGTQTLPQHRRASHRNAP